MFNDSIVQVQHLRFNHIGPQYSLENLQPRRLLINSDNFTNLKRGTFCACRVEIFTPDWENKEIISHS